MGSQSGDNPPAAGSQDAESAAGVRFQYERSRSVDRDDRYGVVMRWVGTHPISAGLAGGLGVVLIASLVAPRGIATAPVQAGILSLMVIAIWGVLFYFMREFFLDQARRETKDTYALEADAEVFRFERNGRTEAEIQRPDYRLRRPPGVEAAAEPSGSATRVWLFVRGRSDDEAAGDVFVLETNITAGEAAEYPAAASDVQPDETLPIHLASGLLQLADRAE